MPVFDSLLDLIRDSSLVRLRPRMTARPGARLWAQFELGLPGAMKDRVALQMVEDAEARGRLRPGDVIVESSSGTMAEGLARVGALKGYRVVIVTDPRLDDITFAKLRALGAEVEVVDEYDAQGGWQTARLRRLREVMTRTPRAFWTCQYDSPSNPRAYAAVASFLVQTWGARLAAIVGSVGSGGSLCGTARAARRALPGLRVVAVDAVGSVLFNQPDRKRLQSGHGNSVVPGNIDYRAIDEVHWVSDGEAFHACRELARRNGIFAGGSSGAVYLVGSWLAQLYDAEREVVVILPDRGDRYHATIYSDAYLEQAGLTSEVAAAEPLEIRYGVDVARRWSRAALPHDGSHAYCTPQAPTTARLADELGLTTPAAAR